MSFARAAVPAVLAVLVTFGRARSADAQGCVVVRPIAPAATTQGGYLEDGEWQLSLGYRWFRSSREYRGSGEDAVRTSLGAADIDEIHAWTLDVAYALSSRFALALTVPYQIAERSEPIYSLNQSSVVARNRSAARGIGDVTLSARGWIVRPERRPPVNVLVTAGMKLPTGADNATDTFRAVGAAPAVRTVDASIQPGDGGIGFTLGFQAFATLGRVSPYLSASYLANPRATNGVDSYLTPAHEGFLSVPDGYLVRAGAVVPLGDHVAPGLGVRVEGTPVHDVLGGSDGFRRPGYSASIEPTVAATFGPWTVTASVPVAFARARLRSVAEREDGIVGDASFADFSILAGMSYRFAGPEKKPEGIRSPAAVESPLPATVRLGDLPVAAQRIGLAVPAMPGAKLTLVNLWASWCKPCREEIPVLDEASALYRARQVEIVGLSADDDPATANQYVHEVPFRYASFWAGRGAAAALGASEIPATFALDANGRLVDKRIGALSREDLAAWIDALLVMVGGPP